MARLSTGQSYGDTEQQTSQRLVGAAEQGATGGELARQQMGVAAIQPQAAPVNTFQQVGAPTLGGAVKLFAPPELPAPSQDMMALAKSLGQFSTGLQEFYTSYTETKQAEAEVAGRMAAQELSRAYPGQQFVEIRDALYRKAKPADGSPGDPAAQRMYDRLQAMSPLQQAYAQRQLARAVMNMALSSAPDRFSRMTTVPGPDGKPVDVSTLRPGDPLLLQAKASLLPVITDPVVAKEFEPQIYSLNVQLDSAQAKLVRNRLQSDAEFAASRNLEAGLMANLSQEELARNMTQMLSEARTTLGIDGYQGLINNLPSIFKSVQEKISLQAGTSKTDVIAGLADKISFITRTAEAGPPGSGITLSQMMGAKGGAAAEVEIYRSSMAILREAQQNNNTTSAVQGQNLAEQAATMSNVNEQGISPVERERRKAGAMQWLAQQGLSPTTLIEATSQLDRIAKVGEMAYDEPMRKEAKRRLVDLENSTADPNLRLGQLDQMIVQGIITPEDAQPTRGRLERERAQRALPESKEYEMIIKDQVKRLHDHLVNQGQGLTQQETRQIADFERTLRSGIANTIEDANNKRLSPDERRKSVVDYLTKQGNTIQTRIDTSANPSRQALIPDVNRYYEQRGPVRTSRPPMGPQLSAAVDAGVVFPEGTFQKAVNDWVFNNTISPEVRQVIKDAGYGTRAGEFFQKQWRNIYPGREMPGEFKDRFQRLNGQQLAFTRPTTTTSGFAMVSPRANAYLNLGELIRGTANVALNATMGRANAATTEPGMSSFAYRGPVPVGAKNAVVTTARELGIDPVVLASVISLETGGTFDKDKRGGAGGNYQGLIQFGPSERRTYGYREGMSFEEQMVGPVLRYLKARGVRPGHTAQEVYAAILTGNVANIRRGGLDWKDSFGTSVRGALPSLTRGGHYKNALRFLAP